MPIPEDGGAVSSALPAAEPSGGANQTRVRAYNERLVLSLVRRHGSQSKAEITRRTGLSAQTVSVIMRSLEKDGLLRRGAPVRGRVGQPSTPLHLNPDAVFSFGLKIGRRSADLVLMDFVGHIRKHRRRTYPFPLPRDIIAFLQSALSEISAELTPAERGRIAGLGIAAPFELWNWAEQVGAPRGTMDAWRSFDLQAEVAALVPYPVHLQNDATSACGAELVFGAGPAYPDFIYFFVGSFIGGGIVLNGCVRTRRSRVPMQGRNLTLRPCIHILSAFACAAGDQPQHLSLPALVSIESTPEAGLSVISVVPVSKKSLPGVGAGFSPLSANFLIASMPSEAISSGYCCEVAPMTPSATFFTPGQPPSMETISVSFSLPTAFSAS